jgi:hypothetical protein
MVDRSHFSAIADSVRAVLQSRRRFLNATRDGKGTPLSDELYFEIECRLGELRRHMAAAGCFTLRRQHYSTAKEAKAYEALRTLAKEVGESPQAPVVASAPAPLAGKGGAARLAEVLTTLKEFLRAPPVAPPPEQPAPPRLTVDLACKTIMLDGVTHDVSSDLALRWVKVLAEHRNEWISSPELKIYDSELDGARPDRFKQFLPETIRSLIDANRKKGSRLRLP